MTFLVGPNSSGKSSILSALMFLAQSGFLDLSWQIPVWSGTLVDLGSFKDVVRGHQIAREVAIHVDLRNWSRSWWSDKAVGKPARPIRVGCEIAGGADPIGLVRSFSITDVNSGTKITVARQRGRSPVYKVAIGSSVIAWDPSKIQLRRHHGGYLAGSIRKALVKGDGKISGTSATTLRRYVDRALWGVHGHIQRITSGRLGPSRLYPRVSREAHQWSPLMDRDQLKLDSVDPAVANDLLEGGIEKSSLKTLLREIGLAKDARLVNISGYHSVLEIQDYMTSEWSNLHDVGYGISQAIPILMACLSRSRGPLLIEQPEIHLHPAAQGRLAELILRTSERRQVLVETHSEHLINKARIAVAKGQMSPRDVIVNYVEHTSKGSKVTTIEIDEHGNFSREWPSGFFDERYRDTMELASLGEAQS